MLSHPLAGLFYVVQFERDPHDAIDRIVERLIPGGAYGETAQQLTAKIDTALASQAALAELDMSGTGHSEETIRSFLCALRERLAIGRVG